MDATPNPLIVPVFVPHGGCPHQCSFCNQSLITGKAEPLPSPSEIGRQIERFLEGCRETPRPWQIAFFGGNFLGLSPETILAYLAEATRFVSGKRPGGIRFSTRPDTIDPERLALLAGFPVQTVEIGVQSMDDTVLARSRRGHSAADTVRAAGLVRERGYQLGLQIMVGLPGDDEEISMETARQVAALAPDMVRIYPTVVVAGSPLARWYREGAYRPWSLERAVAHTARLLRFFREKDIRVIRMGLQATDDLQPGDSILAGPWHPAFGHLVHARVFLERAMALIEARVAENGGRRLSEVVLRVHPRSESRLRGERNENMRMLAARFGLKTLAIQKDVGVSEDAVAVLYR